MAIMWDPPAEHPSFEPTAAELAWRQWLMQALVDTSGQAAPEVKPRDHQAAADEASSPSAA